ncbi:MAG: hypothetical protein R2940_04525 [Syntrophotaleaceae bacterium]
MRLPIARKLTIWAFPLLILSAPALAFAETGGPVKSMEAAAILSRMTAAFDRLEAYHADVESATYRNGRRVDVHRFRYSFQKPGRIRIDMKMPNPGMQMIYPDQGGRVFIRFGGWKDFLTFRLTPDNKRIVAGMGQRFDQTDLGLLIANIGRSIGAGKKGELHVLETKDRVVWEVLAQDHFRSGIVTRYRYVIDPALWLPVTVEEKTPEGELLRIVQFHNLDTTPVFSKHHFQTN